MKTNVKARIEQLKQARRIHGGMVNMCAAAVGVKLSRLPIPSRKIRERIFRTVYGDKYEPIREEDLLQPIGEYRSLNALFTRGVRPEQRPFPESNNQLLCPCDGMIQDLGTLERDTMLTAKGIEYTLDSLVPGVESEEFLDGNYTIFFLSPVDCHRVFCPQSAKLHEVVHVPGRRLLVHPPFQKKEFPVFSLNERIIMRLETELGNCLMVLVAGWGVGNITYPFHARWRNRRRRLGPVPLRKTKRIRPNKRVRMSRRRVTRARFEDPVAFERGEWIATFELGSTVILITPPNDKIVPLLQRDQKVKYGQPAYSFGEEPNTLNNEPL